MTPSELLDSFRVFVDDCVNPVLWSDDEIYEYMDEAQREFCHETNYITDSTTYDAIAVTATTDFVTLPAEVYYIRRARWDGLRIDVMKQLDLDEIPLQADYGNDLSNSNWESYTGPPRVVVVDMEPNKIRLAPVPTEDGVLSLDVHRLPLTEVTDYTASFEVADTSAQRLFKYWMAYLAYQKQDVEVFDVQAADTNRTRFMEGVDKYKARIGRRRTKVGTIAYGGL